MLSRFSEQLQVQTTHHLKSFDHLEIDTDKLRKLNYGRNEALDKIAGKKLMVIIDQRPEV